MKHRLLPTSRVGIIVALSLLAGLFTGCAEEEDKSYTLSLSIDRTSLTADGSDHATVRVMVLDERGYPPPIGERVLLQAQNGVVNGTDQPTADSLTDTTGTAQFSVACSSSNSLRVLAVYKGFNGILMQEVSCEAPPAGDWQLLLSATPRSVSPSGTSTITIDAIRGDGSPVPAGTGIALSIREPNPGARFRSGSPTAQVASTPDANGRVSTVVSAPGIASNFSVCAEFTDKRLGAGQRCVTIQVGTIVIDEATCIGSYTPARISGDGRSTATLTFTVYDDSGQTVSGAKVDAEIGRGFFLEDPSDRHSGVEDILLTTDTGGSADVTILAPNETGTADVEAFATLANGDTLDCRFTESLIFYPPPTCQFDPIGTIGLGASRSVRACFTDFDAPVAAGIRVDFALVSSVGGTALTATTAFTDASGCATTGIATGQTPGGFTIRAALEFGEGESVCQSEAAIQHDGLPSANQMVLSCGYQNIGAYLRRAGIDVTSTCSTVCTANVTDQFNNPIEGAAVYFTSEAGSIEAVGITNAVGVASALFSTRGWSPSDVAPISGEPAGPRGDTRNPRDSLVTVVAWTVGQEAFNDANGNGIYDDGEWFVDISEPFIDANDDDDYTPGGSHETFTDVAVPGRPLNGVFDGPNGVWDAYTQIWASTRILYSGGAFLHPEMLTWNDGPMPAPITRSGIIRFRPIDEYGNAMSSGTSFNATTTCDRAIVSTVENTGDSWGTIDYRRVLRHYVAGSEVSAENPDKEYSLFATEIDFTTNGPWVLIEFNVNKPGAQEECTIVIEWTEAGSSACDDGASDNRLALEVRLPEQL